MLSLRGSACTLLADGGIDCIPGVVLRVSVPAQQWGSHERFGQHIGR
jgi:hypothetical protein